MQYLINILIVLAAFGAVVALVRGIIVFLSAPAENLQEPGPSATSERQNRLMRTRVMFQALAVIFVILFLMLIRG